MDLFVADPQNITTNHFAITGPEALHITKVMRKKTGDRIYFTDGQGWQYEGQIQELGRSAVKGEIIDKSYKPREPGIDLTLAFGLLKGAHNDYIVEKCTEAGVIAFRPFSSDDSVVTRLGPGKLVRLERIARAAMKQSLRTVCPTINGAVTFDALVKQIEKYDRTWLAYEKSSMVLTVEPGAVKRALLIIGPEGGFTEAEVEAVMEKGGQAFTLGKTRLRSDTAAVLGAGLIISQYWSKA